MTDTTDTEQQAAEPTQDTQDREESQDGADDAQDGREAKKYRLRLRDAEAERDSLSSSLDATRRALVDHLAQTTGRITPAALWASGAELDALLTDDGTVDPDKVKAACDKAASLLHVTRRPLPDRAQGYGGDDPVGPQFSDAFTPRNR